MSEATAEPATTPADVEAPAADPAAERAEDRRRLSEHARVHLLYVMGALTLWGAAEAWARRMDAASEVDAFDFRDLVRADGRPINDLNDCTQIAAVQAAELDNLIPA